jgi:hypothetical protein
VRTVITSGARLAAYNRLSSEMEQKHHRKKSCI